MIGRQRRNPFSNILVVIVIGVLAGIIFLVLNGGDSSGTAEDATLAPTSTPGDILGAETLEVVEIAPTQAEPTAVEVAVAQPVNVRADIGIYSLEDAHIIIPAMAINANVTQVYLSGSTWDVSNLGLSVGHLQGTTWLNGVPGNIVLSGHVEMRDGRRGVFAGLDDLQVGALVILRQGTTEKRYAVTDIFYVEPTDLDPVRPTSEERLTLITCDSYDFLQNRYLQRMVVVAEPVS